MNNVVVDFDDKFLAIEHLYTVENYLTLNIKVKSGTFAGAANFCISREILEKTVAALSYMYNKLEGGHTINDNDSDAFINLEITNLGHLYITGQIGGNHEEHSMRFKYAVDQTVLLELIKILQTMK